MHVAAIMNVMFSLNCKYTLQTTLTEDVVKSAIDFIQACGMGC